MQSSDVINGQLIPVVRREAYAPTAWGPTPGQAGGFAPLPTIPPSVGSSSYGVMGAQAPGYTAGLGGASSSTNAGPGGAGNMDAAGIAGLYPWNWKLSPLPLAIIFLLVGIIGLRLVHWK
jgi:hypothetical protein